MIQPVQPSEKIHALVPIYNLGWWEIFAITLIIDWAALLLVKRLEPLGWKRAWHRSSLIGDIFLPIGIASSAIVLRNFTHTDAWYASRVWNLIILAAGIIMIAALEISLILRKRMKSKQLLAPSKLWHTLVFPVMFYFSVPTIGPLFVTRQPLWAFGLALVGYGVWLAALIYDWLAPPDLSRTH